MIPVKQVFKKNPEIFYILLVAAVGFIINCFSPDPVYFWAAVVIVLIGAVDFVLSLFGKGNT